MLVFRHRGGGLVRHVDEPLGIPAAPVDKQAPLTAEDRAFIADVADRHLLPRFALPTVVRLGLFDDVQLAALGAEDCSGCRRGDRSGRSGLCPGSASGPRRRPRRGLLPAHLRGVSRFSRRNGGRCGCCACPPPRRSGSSPWPACCPVAGFTRRRAAGWRRGRWPRSRSATCWSRRATTACARGAAPLRSALVVVVGAVHALLVSLIALVVVLPAFVGDGQGLLVWIGIPATATRGVVLALAAAWCLAVGVFSQILWDDRPITARWRT